MSSRKKELIRRQQVMHQRIAVAVLTICIIICGVLLGSSILASGRSRASKEHASFKYYTCVEIAQGDTLWSIASNYITPEYDTVQEYIAEIKELNQLGSDDIHSGQYLTIPYYSSEFH